MRSHYLQHEEQQLIHKQLGEVKAEANRHVYMYSVRMTKLHTVRTCS